MHYTVYNVTDNSIVSNANITKETLLVALEKEGLLKESAEEISKKYAIVMHKKGRLGSWIDKLFGVKDDEKMWLRVMKVV